MKLKLTNDMYITVQTDDGSPITHEMKMRLAYEFEQTINSIGRVEIPNGFGVIRAHFKGVEEVKNVQ